MFTVVYVPVGFVAVVVDVLFCRISFCSVNSSSLVPIFAKVVSHLAIIDSKML